MAKARKETIPSVALYKEKFPRRDILTFRDWLIARWLHIFCAECGHFLMLYQQDAICEVLHLIDQSKITAVGPEDLLIENNTLFCPCCYRHVGKLTKKDGWVELHASSVCAENIFQDFAVFEWFCHVMERLSKYDPIIQPEPAPEKTFWEKTAAKAKNAFLKGQRTYAEQYQLGQDAAFENALLMLQQKEVLTPARLAEVSGQLDTDTQF